MKVIWKSVICSLLTGIFVLLIAIASHKFFDKEHSSKESAQPTHTVVVADNSPIGTYNWVAVIASIIALGISALTLYSQEKVAENTSMLSHKAQEEVLYDLIRHFYRNMIAMWAIVNRIDDAATRHNLRKNKEQKNETTVSGPSTEQYYTAYPSEVHLEKAKVPSNNIHPELYVNDDYKYNIINEFLLELRNYNLELEVASKHFQNTKLAKEIIDYDIDTLLFKPAQLTNRTMKVLASLKGLSLKTRTEISILEFLSKYCKCLWKRYAALCLKRHDMELSDEIRSIIDTFKNSRFIDLLRENVLEQKIKDEIAPNCEDIIIKNHNKNVADNKNCDQWEKRIEYYTNPKPYTNLIFNTNPELFFKMLNEDAQIECGKNMSGGDKLLIIGIKS